MTQPESSHAYQAIEEIRQLVRTLHDVVIGDGRNPGIAEQVRDNRKDIQRLKKARASEDPSVTKARLRMIAEALVALAAVSALIMQLLGG